jgi:hypothetical protein
LVFYLAGIAATFWKPSVAQAIYLVGALTWLIPDRRAEHALAPAPAAGRAP